MGVGWECEDRESRAAAVGEVEVEDEKYLLHVSFRHINVSIHLLKVLLCPVGLLAVPLEPPLTLQKRRGKPRSHMSQKQQERKKA